MPSWQCRDPSALTRDVPDLRLRGFLVTSRFDCCTCEISSHPIFTPRLPPVTSTVSNSSVDSDANYTILPTSPATTTITTQLLSRTYIPKPPDFAPNTSLVYVKAGFLRHHVARSGRLLGSRQQEEEGPTRLQSMELNQRSRV